MHRFSKIRVVFRRLWANFSGHVANGLRLGLAILAFGLAVALLIAVGLPNRADYTGQFVSGIGRVAPEIGAFAPPITGRTVENALFDLEPSSQKTRIINFWATWCVPCQIEMPLLQTIQDECSASVQVVGINAGEQAALVADWLKTNHLTFVILIDDNQQLQTRYRVLGLPSTYVIAPTGKITAIFYGAVSETALRATLENCIAD